MDSKVADRYVRILTFVIDVVYRNNQKDTEKAVFDRNDIFKYISGITDKTYKKSIEWFVERNIFEKKGNTFTTHYKLHPQFQFRLSAKEEGIKRQCEYIIAQLGTFSNKIWDEATEATSNLYEDFFEHSDRFALITSIKEQSIKDTVSEVILNEYNEENKGIYPYELLQTMILNKSPFNIEIKNSELHIKMKSVKLKKVTFNTDTITLKFNNSKFEIESLENIKLIEIPKTKNLKNRVDKSLQLLEKYDYESVKPLINLMIGCQNKEDIFFQPI